MTAKTKNRIEIKSYHDLNDIMSDMLDEFLSSLIKIKGMTRKPNYNYDGEFANEVRFMYTQEAMILIDRYKKRMQKVFYKNFPDGRFYLTPTLLIMP